MSSFAPASADLGEVEPARTRQAGRRSTVAVVDDALVVGTADGGVVARDGATFDVRWRAPGDSPSTSVVTAVPFDGGVVVGERGPVGEIRFHEGESGDVRWRHVAADDVGPSQKETRFFFPFVVDAVSDGTNVYVAARRYERTDSDRSFESAVYAFTQDGDVVWRYETDASPIALDADGRRVAVGYNRCPGDHQHGLVVLDAETGAERLRWDPGTAGQRRVGDVSLVGSDVVLTSHGDFCGYRLADDGREQWRADLATPTTVGDETLYAYPNHVHATAEGALFVTGNTYPEEGRETTSLHPREHAAFGFTPDGERSWSASVGGFATEVAADGNLAAVPTGQQFRTRDPSVHGVRTLDVRDGVRNVVETEGIATAVAIDEGTLAAVEEPVVYHDEGVERGAYRLHRLSA